MDLVSSCKEKLQYFRIKELKDALTTLGLSKQGKKQDLVERILSFVSDEQVSKSTKKSSIRKEDVAKLVDDIYRKMQVSGATDLASKGQGVLDSSKTVIKGEVKDSFHLDSKVRCVCGSISEQESLIKVLTQSHSHMRRVHLCEHSGKKQKIPYDMLECHDLFIHCEDPRCRVWQHMNCVIIPEKPTDSTPQLPDVFYCETCRLSRADPFWVTVANPLLPVKLATSIPTDGSSPVQSVDKTFPLSRADKDLLTKPEYDVQAWCMLLNDKVPYRMQWPQYADLQVNGVPVRAINRPGSQLLGANGRDDGPIITPCAKDVINKITLSGCDARIFCLGVRIVKRRTVQQILNLIPKESDGECFEDALARVCRCVGGGAGEADNADSDSDLEVVAESFSVNLRCPMSGSRMKVAGRFKPCAHMGCFDLDVFVEMNQRSRKWQCPICLKNYSLENVIIDPYFNRITSKMRHCGEDTTEIEVKPDGSWRVKTKTDSERREVGELTQWHNSDGSLCVANGELKAKVEVEKYIKQEGTSDGHNGTGLKLGIRKNRNGFWEVSKPEDVNTSSSGNRLLEKFENHEQKVIPMSSSATGSGRDGEDASVNQDGGENFDFANNGMELDSISLNVDSAYGLSDRNFSAPVGDAEVIVLSDSDEDNDILLTSAAAYKNNQTDMGGAAFSMPPPVPYTEDPTVGSGLGFLNPNDDEFGMPLWPLPAGSQAGPGFQLFNSDVPDSLVDLQHGPINCPMSMNGYTLAPDTVIGPASLVQDSSVGRSDTDNNDGLVDNPLAFGGEDPSLQIFLPTRPSDASGQSDLRDQADVSNGVRREDWISLRLGGSGTAGSHADSAPANGLNPRPQAPSREGGMDSLTDTASLLLGMNDRSEKASRQRSDSPFTFPRQKRSVRPRLFLSIDSGSE